jgi:serine/threonine-protein kinase
VKYAGFWNRLAAYTTGTDAADAVHLAKIGGERAMSELLPSQNFADRNLLFGILALQMDFISRDALIAAMHAWVLDKAKPLGLILYEQSHLGVERLRLLEAIVAEHLKAHGNDVQQSLAALSSVSSVKQNLQAIDDPELHVSLDVIGSNVAPRDPVTAVDDVQQAGPRFRILRPHAQGGLGAISVAEDLELHREVALKEIQEKHADDPHSRDRFLLEAEITGGLEHRGIVPVYSLGSYADGRPFYAMRFIKGDNLMEASQRFHQADKPGRDPGERSLALRRLLGRFVDVCNAVAYAHSRGVLHRDLKPGNIMLGKFGETLVVDWGLAKVAGRAVTGADGDEPTLRPPSGSAHEPTQAGAAVGTPEYMSPEQAAGRPDLLGPASDVYSLGATLYTLLTGRPAFRRQENRGETLRQVQQGAFPRPREVKKEVPAALEAVFQKAMALKPENRYPTALALAADVERWLADEPVSARREPLWERAWRLCRRRPVVAAWLGFGAAGNLVLIVALVGLFVWQELLAVVPFLGFAWVLGVLFSVTIVAQLAALLGAALGAFLGTIIAAILRESVKERAARGIVVGAKSGLIVGAILGYVMSVYGLNVIRSDSLYSPYDDASILMLVALGVGLLGPVLGFGLGAIRKASRERHQAERS